MAELNKQPYEVICISKSEFFCFKYIIKSGEFKDFVGICTVIVHIDLVRPFTMIPQKNN